MTRFFTKFGTVLAGFAMLMAVIAANSACVFFTHQEKLPEGAEKLRKF